MYLSHEVVNWVCTVSFVVYAFIRFYFGVLVLLLLLLLWLLYFYILSYHLCSIPPVSYFDHIIPCIFHTWRHLLSLCLLLYACTHDTIFNIYSYKLDLLIHVLIPACHLAFAIPLVGEFWLSWILMSRSWKLELVDSPGCWSEWRNKSVFIDWPSEALSFQAPLLGSQIILLWLVSAFTIVHYRIPLCILAFMFIGDVIFL